jgi:hypothetical protein
MFTGHGAAGDGSFGAEGANRDALSLTAAAAVVAAETGASTPLAVGTAAAVPAAHVPLDGTLVPTSEHDSGEGRVPLFRSVPLRPPSSRPTYALKSADWLLV